MQSMLSVIRIGHLRQRPALQESTTLAMKYARCKGDLVMRSKLVIIGTYKLEILAAFRAGHYFKVIK